MKRLFLNDWYRLMSNNIVSSVLKTKEYLQSAGMQIISLKFRNNIQCLTFDHARSLFEFDIEPGKVSDTAQVDFSI